MNCEVLIIGGGVIGLSIARELHKKGVRRIIIVDRGPIGGEASWAAAGMLAPNIETDTSDDFHGFGIESLELYPLFAADLLAETGVNIELDQRGTICLAFDDAEESALNETFTRQRSRGVHVELLSGESVRALEPSVSVAAGAGLLYPDDCQVENRKLIAALRKYAETTAIRIIENTEVLGISVDGRRVTAVRTRSETLKCDVTILATGAWTSLIKIGDAVLPISIKPIRGQMISFETGGRRFRRVTYSSRGYLVPRADGRILAGATVEDVGFDKSTTARGTEMLLRAAVEIAPLLAEFTISRLWAGLRPFAADGLPVIGGVPGYDNLFVATAHYRNGILLAPKTAEIIADRIINNVESPYLRSFGGDRFSPAATRAWL